jgi:hypothetical protein
MWRVFLDKVHSVQIQSDVLFAEAKEKHPEIIYAVVDNKGILRGGKGSDSNCKGRTGQMICGSMKIWNTSAAK